MSFTEEMKKDFRVIRNYWDNLDPKIRFLDIAAIGQILLFALSFIIISAFKIDKIVSNMAMMAYPVIMAGVLFIYRSKLQKFEDNEEKKAEAYKEFMFLFILFTVMIALTFIYAIPFALINN
ncbi:MAG: hypothetical protein INQ03_05605 [Candidatus Heimdallarchaeota archaeon]|nr:hypothetical protein [Candidatus Heimdallarchaeota archaeon]